MTAKQTINRSQWDRTPADYRKGHPDTNNAEVLLGFAGAPDKWVAVDVVDDSPGGRH